MDVGTKKGEAGTRKDARQGKKAEEKIIRNHRDAGSRKEQERDRKGGSRKRPLEQYTEGFKPTLVRGRRYQR